MRLIDADKLYEDYIHRFFYKSEYKLDDIQEWIDDQPTVNPYEWISVKDRLPPLQEKVIVAIRYDGGDSPYEYTTCGWMASKTIWIVDDDVSYDVTHWMPFPEYPANKDI